jgi:3-hydroxyacyl-CoA dehydrogenase/enoyl-CoA hydratase/3-hydroxybutyryl-CoA epimerase
MAFFQRTNLRIEKNSEESAVLVLDVAQRSVNVFNRQVLADLDDALNCLLDTPALKLLGIRSGSPSKPFAGADIESFAAIQNAEEAKALSELGQRLFDKLANLPMPTLIALHGPCLGGGLEFALACDYRLVRDDRKTQLGFPEVELGLIPGWGGTQRLPRRIGLERALQLILGSKRLSAREAVRWNLADRIAGEQDYAAALRQLGLRAVREGKRPAQALPLRTWRQRMLESNPIGRWMLFAGSRRILTQRVPEDMPAPAEALDAVRIGLRQGMAAGLAYEREAVGRLATTSACRNLVGLFLQNEQARKLPAVAAGSPDHATTGGAIRRVGIVGAGIMGAGIAQLAALRGFEIVVQEVNEAALAAGIERIASLLQKAAERRLVSPEEARQKLASIQRTTSWEGFGDVDVVVEAAVEELSLKQALFRELERRTRPATLLATNTSSLLVRQLQEGLEHPQRVAGLHFFNPVHKLLLVEVARAPATSESTITALSRWAVALGKTPVRVADSPGFIVNRILMPYLFEAVVLAAQGVPVTLLDTTMRRFGMPMGPLELLDQVGLDVAAHVAGALRPIFTDRLGAPAGLEALSQTFEQMRQKRWLGQKSGIGFYRYRGRSKKPHRDALNLLPAAWGRDASELMGKLPPAVQRVQSRERMVLLMVKEAAACLGERVAENAEAIDLAMVLGTGWAPHRGGPLHYADDRGLDKIVQVLEDLAKRWGPRFAPGAELQSRAAARRPFCSGSRGASAP